MSKKRLISGALLIAAGAVPAQAAIDNTAPDLGGDAVTEAQAPVVTPIIELDPDVAATPYLVAQKANRVRPRIKPPKVRLRRVVPAGDHETPAEKPCKTGHDYARHHHR